MSDTRRCCILEICCAPQSESHVEAVAAELHEAGGEEAAAFAGKGQAVVPFVAWDKLDEVSKEGARVKARALLAKYKFVAR